MKSKILGLLAVGLLAGPTAANAAILLDFDTAATGSQLAYSPLVTTAGTVTLSALGAPSVVAIGSNGRPTNGIQHEQNGNDASRALLSFDFDVASITFDFAGEGFGNFLAEALDIGGVVIASYSFTGTNCSSSCWDGTNINLAGPGIRAFRFADAPDGGQSSFVDNLRLSVVPEPGTLALLGLGLAGLGLARRRRAN